MRSALFALISLGLAIAAPQLQAADAVLKPSLLTYDVAWGGTSLGEGTLSLTPEGAQCFQYQLKTRPVGVVRWLYGSPSETSDFCVVGGVVQPSKHQFSNPKREKDGFTLQFDFKRGQVTGGRTSPLAIPPGTVDRLSIHQAARLWVMQNHRAKSPGLFKINVADHKRVKAYTFAITGRGSVETVQGKFDAIRFERVDDAKTTLRFWLAPEKDFMPVKVEHIEDGETKLRMSLK